MSGKSKLQLEKEEKAYQKKLEKNKLTPEAIKNHDDKILRNNKLKARRLASKTGRIITQEGNKSLWFIPPTIIYSVVFIETGHTYIGTSSTKNLNNIINEIIWKINNGKFCTKKVNRILLDYEHLTPEISIIDDDISQDIVTFRKEELIMAIPLELRLNTSYRLNKETVTDIQRENVIVQRYIDSALYEYREKKRSNWYHYEGFDTPSKQQIINKAIDKYNKDKEDGKIKES